MKTTFALGCHIFILTALITGTLTRSRLAVTDLVPINGVSPSDLLSAAACFEVVSEHPLAKAVLRKAVAEGVNYNEPLEFVSFPGQGIKARVNGAWGIVGNLSFVNAQGVPVSSFETHVQRLESEGKTTMLVSLGRIQGILGIADALRAEAVSCVKDLKSSGIKHISLISGDNERVVAAVAQSLGIEEYYAGMLPEKEVAAVKDIISRYAKTAMVGDGINDAPALASATIGIWLDGRNVLRGPGSYRYHAEPEWLDYFPGVAAHNTVQFDELEAMPRLGRFLFGDWLRLVAGPVLEEVTGSQDFVAGYRHASGARHERKVSLRTGKLEVCDTIAGFRHKAVVRWRLMPGAWQVDAAGVSLDQLRLTVQSDGGKADIRLVEGWEARCYGRKTRLPVLEIEMRHAGRVTTRVELNVT